MRRKIVGATLAIIVPVAILVMIYCIISVHYANRYYPGTWINGVDCSNLTVDEVKEKLKEHRQSYTLKLNEREDKQEVLTSEDIGYLAIFDSVSEIKTEQGMWNWISHLSDINYYTAEGKPGFEEDKLRSALNALDCVSGPDVTAPTDAYVDYTDGIKIVPETQGTTVDTDKLYEVVSQAILNNQNRIDLDAEGCYVQPAITMETPEFKEVTEQIQKYTDVTITLNVADTTEVINSEQISQWLYQDEDGELALDKEKIRSYMYDMEDKYDTTHKTRNFVNSYGNTVKIQPGTLGWSIAANNETEQIYKEIIAGEDVTRDIEYDSEAPSWGDNDIGNTYVEISIDNQHMWYYKNGKLLVDTDVTTGTSSTGHDTSRGAFYLNNKQMNVTLVSTNPDDPYESKVTYWLPFKGNTYGIHDASWRSSYGGSYYIYNGSHGCVNTPFNSVKTIYENITVGTPVIIW